MSGVGGVLAAACLSVSVPGSLEQNGCSSCGMSALCLVHNPHGGGKTKGCSSFLNVDISC